MKTRPFRPFPLKSFRAFAGRLLQDDRGSALILTIILAVVGAMLMVAGTRLITQSMKETVEHTQTVAEADNAARAGLVDALSWFKRKGNVSHAVLGGGWADDCFFPRSVPATVNGSPDTMDESIGLVKEYPISAAGISGQQLWMRYEVRRQRWPTKGPDGSPVPTATPMTPVATTAPTVVTGVNTPTITPTPTQMPWDPYAAHDVTGQRWVTPGPDGSGTYWSVSSVGYVFRRANPSASPAVQFNKSPNKVLAKSVVSTEFKRLDLNLPYNGTAAAVYMADPCNSLSVNAMAVVDGAGGKGLACNANGVPSVSGSGSQLNGGSITISGATFDSNSIFGMPEGSLKGLADYAVNAVTELYTAPATTLSPEKLYFINGNAVFDSTHQFASANSILYVKGNLTVNPGVYQAYFWGVVYVTGNVTLNPPCIIDGALIAQGTISLNPTNINSNVNVVWDPDTVTNVENKVGQYRENQGAVRTFSGLPPN